MKTETITVPTNKRKAPQKWTIMIYMAGDNNLADEMIWALQEIKATELAKDITVRILFDPGDRRKVINIIGRRNVLNPRKNSKNNNEVNPFDPAGPIHTKLLASAPFFKVVQRLPAKNGQKKRRKRKLVLAHRVRHVLQAFVRDTVIDHRAENYMLILAGHGSGAVGDFLGNNRRSASLSIKDIRTVLEDVSRDFGEREFKKHKAHYSRINILGLDSCLMSMTEVAYEVRRSVDYLIGAEGFEPDNGWPYFRILGSFNALATKRAKGETVDSLDPLDPRIVAKAIVRTYSRNYLDYADADISTDLAALDLKQIENLKVALNGLAAALTRKLTVGSMKDIMKDAVTLAHWEAQGYKFEQYVDLWDFCQRLKLQCDKISPVPQHLREACKGVQDAIDGLKRTRKAYKGVVVESRYTGAAFQHSHGVSLFFPWSVMTDAAGEEDLRYYRGLLFVKQSKWARFLEAYLQRSQRFVRSGDDAEVQYNKRNKKPIRV